MSENITAAQSYLYQLYEDMDGQVPSSWHAHRITKITDKFFYVGDRACGHWTPSGVILQEGRDRSEKNWRIPRSVIEQEGSYMIRGKWWQVFYLRPEAIEEVQP